MLVIAGAVPQESDKGNGACHDIVELRLRLANMSAAYRFITPASHRLNEYVELFEAWNLHAINECLASLTTALP